MPGSRGGVVGGGRGARARLLTPTHHDGTMAWSGDAILVEIVMLGTRGCYFFIFLLFQVAIKGAWDVVFV